MGSKDLIKIGTSGFSYDDWLGNFYPQFCPKADYLRYYSSKFSTVEIDATYYRIPNCETVKKWCCSTPQDFVFAAKFPRTVTHEGDSASRIAQAKQFIETMKHLDCKLGPLLLQFPYSFKPDQRDFLMKLIESLPDGHQIAIELRNKYWLKVDEIFELLKAKNIAFCLIDHPWMPKTSVCTADFSYIRFLGDRKKIEEDFTYVRDHHEESLEWWKDVVVDFCKQGKTVFGFFNNHYSGHSPSTANLMLQILERATA
jgi:uncharacterized protein YecE (DUF72 family)